MRLKTLHIKNFRALEDINIQFDTTKRANVIVGPNAIGKTTILEAIRLSKGVLAPRTASEPTNVLTSLGASSPHLPNRVMFNRIARDINKVVEIKTEYEVLPEEVQQVEGSLNALSTNILQVRLGNNIQGPLGMIQYLSTQAGRDELANVQKEMQAEFDILKQSRICNLTFIADPPKNQVRGVNQMQQIIIAFLDGQQPTSQTLFSYFPADRAMSIGDVPIQIGPHDITAQLESHNSQPQTKYNRLKNTIFNNLLQGADAIAEMKSEFASIFSSLLRGRRFENAGIDNMGFAFFNVTDTSTNRTFDLDGMSSGEKGLILTFLLIARSLGKNGIVLLDEPELHLNPAVCKTILPFLIDNYCVPKSLQAIICTHSAEILGGAFGRQDCALYHLVSEKVISVVSQKDRDEVTDALARLGTSESEDLLYKGTIFVEGDHDVQLLEEGFGEIVGRYNIKDLGGRREIEKQIAELQSAEKASKVNSARYFIFDKDNLPTKLQSTNLIKVLQWDRRCFENYLLEADAVYDVLHEDDVASNPIRKRGEAGPMLKKLAMSQLVDTAAREVYAAFQYKSPGARTGEIEGKCLSDIAKLLFERISEVNDQFRDLAKDKWEADFVVAVDKKIAELNPAWESDWVKLCDGKRLFVDLHRETSPKMSVLALKKRVLASMRASGTKPGSLLRLDQLLKSMLEN